MPESESETDLKLYSIGLYRWPWRDLFLLSKMVFIGGGRIDVGELIGSR